MYDHPPHLHLQGCRLSFPPGTRGASTKDIDVLPLGRWGGGQGFLPGQRLLSCENHLFAEVAYLQVAPPGPLHPRTYRLGQVLMTLALYANDLGTLCT